MLHNLSSIDKLCDVSGRLAHSAMEDYILLILIAID
jgi:hypothetical protein